MTVYSYNKPVDIVISYNEIIEDFPKVKWLIKKSNLAFHYYYIILTLLNSLNICSPIDYALFYRT